MQVTLRVAEVVITEDLRKLTNIVKIPKLREKRIECPVSDAKGKFSPLALKKLSKIRQ